MFDIGFWEISIIGIVALVIVGPERLPGVARTAGLWVGKARRMISDVKRDIDRELKASEMSDMSDIKNEYDKAKEQVKKGTESLNKSTGAEEVTSSLKDTFKEASPLKSEVDEVAKKVSDDLGEAKQSAGQAEKASPTAETKKGANTSQSSSAEKQP